MSVLRARGGADSYSIISILAIDVFSQVPQSGGLEVALALLPNERSPSLSPDDRMVYLGRLEI